MESCIRIKDGSGRLAQSEDEVRRIWKVSTCVALMRFREVTISEESQLEELKLK